METERAKMIWRCRRGIRELDSVLMPFAEDCYAELSSVDVTRMQYLLGCHDNQILDWILGREVPEEDLQRLIGAIIRHSKRARIA